jgi:hypothetical protein
VAQLRAAVAPIGAAPAPIGATVAPNGAASAPMRAALAPIGAAMAQLRAGLAPIGAALAQARAAAAQLRANAAPIGANAALPSGMSDFQWCGIAGTGCASPARQPQHGNDSRLRRGLGGNAQRRARHSPMAFSTALALFALTPVSRAWTRRTIKNDYAAAASTRGTTAAAVEIPGLSRDRSLPCWR